MAHSKLGRGNAHKGLSAQRCVGGADATPFADGARARKLGMTIHQCPYRGSYSRYIPEWERGWRSAGMNGGGPAQ